ncbi:hypothetical protein [Cohnella zeiphila]|uniref:Uncharacterized protein n=1 Tax=Cohnella zeiphila TaxID=2761120 RepID=A0A7X0SPU8_9BACL|nr:hypothetical protein [Cohnella zeiphila]MBB6732675.1 hypothetical protein [Cohnella zeiphila]
MKKLFSFVSIASLAIAISIPAAAEAAAPLPVNEHVLSKDKINSLLSTSLPFDPSTVHTATEEEVELIKEKAKQEKLAHPDQAVDLQEVLEDLNLSDLTIVSENEMNKISSSQVQPFAASGIIDAGGIGFESYSRDATYFRAQAHVFNSVPLTTIDQIAGYVEGFRQLSLDFPTSYVVMFNEFYDARNIGYGNTKVLDPKSIAHLGLIAKMTITGVVKVGEDTRTLTNTIVSNTNGTFTNG